MRFHGLRSIAAAGLLVALGGIAGAQSSTPKPPSPGPAKPETCPGLVSFAPRAIPTVVPVALAAGDVRITFVGHATFLIESPQLVRVATDYNDYVKPPIVPDIATMNRAHSTHFTLTPDPGIKHVLHGWRDDGGPAAHDIGYKDVHVRSVATNIRDWATGTSRHGNSIFIVEAGSLCIAHLGHLHHTLSEQQLAEIGRVDVVLVPIDGSYTLDQEGMVEVLQALKAPLMIPMHYFGRATLERFLDRVRDVYDVEIAETPSLVVSRPTLPSKPKVLVLPGY